MTKSRFCKRNISSVVVVVAVDRFFTDDAESAFDVVVEYTYIHTL